MTSRRKRMLRGPALTMPSQAPIRVGAGAAGMASRTDRAA